VPKVIGATGSTNESFDKVESALSQAISHEQALFHQSADGGLGSFFGLSFGAAVLAVLGAAGALVGIGRRLSEYR